MKQWHGMMLVGLKFLYSLYVGIRPESAPVLPAQFLVHIISD